MRPQQSSRLGGMLYVAGDSPEMYAEVTAAKELTLDGERVTSDAIVLLGGTGQEIGVPLLELFQRDGRWVPFLAIDNDFASRDKVRLRSRTGQQIGIDQRHFLALGEGRKRSELRDYPLLRQRYEGSDGRSGLLRGISVHARYQVAGFGGHALRSVSLLDYDLDIVRLTRRVRRFLLSFKQLEPDDAFAWDRDEPAEPIERPPELIRIWVVFSGAGSCGAAGAYLLPFLIHREAARIGLQVIIYAVCTGPRIYAGLHDHVLENYAATLDDLEAASTFGIEWDLIDGSSLSADVPAYWRIFLFDDADAPDKLEEGETESGETVRWVPEEVRRNFYSHVARSLYLTIASTAIGSFEGAAGNRPTLPWSTMAGTLADLSCHLLAPAVALRRSERRLRAAAGGR